MAALTSYIQMCAVKHESGAEMIKRFLRSRDEAIYRPDEEHQDEKQPEFGRAG